MIVCLFQLSFLSLAIMFATKRSMIIDNGLCWIQYTCSVLITFPCFPIVDLSGKGNILAGQRGSSDVWVLKFIAFFLHIIYTDYIIFETIIFFLVSNCVSLFYICFLVNFQAWLLWCASFSGVELYHLGRSLCIQKDLDTCWRSVVVHNPQVTKLFPDCLQ